MYKKITVSIAVLSLFVLAIATPVSAGSAAQLLANINNQTSAFTGSAGANLGIAVDPRLAVAQIIKSTLVLLATIILVYMMYGGYLFFTAGGNDIKVTQGKSTLVNAAIGLLIILSAYGIAQFASRFASGDSNKQGNYCQIQPSTLQNLDPLNGDPSKGIDVPKALGADCIPGNQ